MIVVDGDDDHRYQPGFLFVPFGIHAPREVTRSRRKVLHRSISLVYGDITRIDADANEVHLANGSVLGYHTLMIATGVEPCPDQGPGLLGQQWWRTIHEFYSYQGSVALAEALRTWPGGRLVVHIADMPIKCPVAPLEFAFLADSYFRDRGIRDQVDLTYVTPLDAAFTKPIAARAFGTTLYIGASMWWRTSWSYASIPSAVPSLPSTRPRFPSISWSRSH